MSEKFDQAYKSIGEVAKILDLVNKKNGSLNTGKKNLKILNLKFFQGKEDITILEKQKN